MAANDIGGLSIEYRDYDGEPTSITFFRESVVAADWETVQPDFSGVKTALNALTLGENNRTEFMPLINANYPAVRATSSAARREDKWRLIFRDTVTLKPYKMKIGTADMNTAAFRQLGSDKADMTHAAWVTLKTALDDFGIINPETGNPMTLVDAEMVGKDD